MKYEITKMKDVYTLLSELANKKEDELEIFIPSGALILENKLNLQFLANSLEKLGKSVKFETDDPKGVELLSNLNAASSIDLGETYISEKEDSSIFSGIVPSFPPISLKKLPKVNIPKLRGFSFKLNFVLLGIIVASFIGISYLAQRYVSSQKAYIKIVTKSEPMARSLTIRVDSQGETTVGEQILAGKDLSTSVFETVEIETTGEKIIGEYASGEIKIYNRTEEPIELDEGSEVVYKGKDSEEDKIFILEDTVEVPPLAYEVPEDPASTMIPGEAEVSVEATEFGADYNIDSDSTFEFDDYKKSELVAKSSEDFEGGSSETVPIVSEEDLENLKAEAQKQLEAKAPQALEDAVPSGYKLVQGSLGSNLGNMELNHEVGDEAEKVRISQSLSVTGLAYSEKELDQLIMQIVGEYVPEEYALSGTTHTLNVEVLGETENTLLSPTAADLQVTVKTSVVPDIKVSDLKQDLKGKSLDEVQRKLGSMRSISTYEFNLSPPVPLKNTVPNDIERILIEIENE